MCNELLSFWIATCCKTSFSAIEQLSATILEEWNIILLKYIPVLDRDDGWKHRLLDLLSNQYHVMWKWYKMRGNATL